MATHFAQDAATGRIVPKHRMTGTPTYHSWEGMISRCHNPNNKGFPAYGGRGIVVCQRWRDSFEAFLADMGPRPSRSHSLDRFPNRAGNYEPGNVRWATSREQNRNKDSVVLLTFRGETLCMTEWAERVGIRKDRISKRLKWGWTVEEALTTPVAKKQKRRAAA